MEKSQKVNNLTIGLSSIAFVGGAVYSFKTNKGFWKGWGISIVSGVLGGILGRGMGTLIFKEEDVKNANALADAKPHTKPAKVV